MNHLNTRLGNQIVDFSNGQVFKWWPENRTEKSLFMVQNVLYSNDLPSHMPLPYEYLTPILSGIQVFGI